jgi:hypothetical protein
MDQRRRDFIKNTTLAVSGLSMFGPLEAFPYMTKSENFQLEIYATKWGFSGNMEVFCEKAKEAGYDGIEVWTPQKQEDIDALLGAVKKHQLKLGLLSGNSGKSYEEHLANFKKGLRIAIGLNPEFINCHSGKDYFNTDQNAQFIEYANDQKQLSGIPIYHETHRGRILFSAPTANLFIDKFADLRLTLDISHWCCVHESLLADQKETIDKVLRRVDHIHSRVGFQEAPQIPNHDDPQYEKAVQAHFAWWDEVVRIKSEQGGKLTMTTEFGPPPYMWTQPYGRKPLADNWLVNKGMMEVWKKRYL